MEYHNNNEVYGCQYLFQTKLKNCYGIEPHNYVVDEVGGWLIERYLNIVQWSVETEKIEN